METYRIFLAEDDDVIAGAVAEHLTHWGYQVVRVQRFDRVLAEFAASDPQLVLLDVMLPFFNGYHWCTEIRKISKVPILFLSSAADNLNQVMAMELGGDDFLPKPFDLSLLTAKVHSLLRRSYAFGAAAQILSCGEAVMNLSDGTLHVRGQAVELTRNERRLLQLLLENRGRTVSRSALMTRLWESDAFVDENTLTVNMTRLRKKLSAAGAPALIRTRKGEGYLVEA